MAQILNFLGLAGRKRKAAPTIGTHDGQFHCDEALGCFMLKQTKEFEDAEIVRTRDTAKLKELDVVIDVGGDYDPATNRYDHHQRGFTEVFGNGFTTKLSSAGLVYKHFGMEIVAGALGLPEDDPKVNTVYLKVYESFMEGVDGVDNGVAMYDLPAEVEPRYAINTALSSRVGKLNPAWNEEASPETVDVQFLKAMQLTGEEFLDAVRYYGKSWLPARSIVQEAVEGRHKLHASGAVIKLARSCPWKEHLYALEQELDISTPILYCLYEDEKRNWRVQAVSVRNGAFESRRQLPASWCGLRDDALSTKTGVEGCIFVHMSGFIGGAKTLAAATALAIKALTAK